MVETTSNGKGEVAARYGAALYALAFEQGRLDQTVDEMAALGRLLVESDVLAKLARDPIIAAAKAGPVFRQALQDQGFSKLVVDFVCVAIANRRLRDLPALIAGFTVYTAGKRGEVVADVGSAHPLTDLQRTQLRARLTQAGYGNVRLTERVDPALLGGMTLKIGAKLYDTSLKSRLERLTYSLKGAA